MDSTITRICKHCTKETNFKNLVKDKRKIGGVIPVCKQCQSKKVRARPGYQAMRQELARKYREDPVFAQRKRLSRQLYHINYLERVILSNAKLRAKRANLEFTIDESDIQIPSHCPLLAIPIYRGTNESKANSPSLDRIDVTKGYIKGNVCVISYKANTMKSDASPELLRLFISNLEKYLNNDIV